MSAHTPGEWFVEVGGSGVCADVSSLPGPLVLGDVICLPPDGDKSLEYWAANARLIAAAPDLLDAILQYRNDMRHPVLEDDRRARRLEMIERAIAKATAVP